MVGIAVSRRRPAGHVVSLAGQIRFLQACGNFTGKLRPASDRQNRPLSRVKGGKGIEPAVLRYTSSAGAFRPLPVQFSGLIPVQHAGHGGVLSPLRGVLPAQLHPQADSARSCRPSGRLARPCASKVALQLLPLIKYLLVY